MAAKKLKKTASNKKVSPRKLKNPAYKSFRLHKTIKHPVRLPPALKITKISFGILNKNWKLFGGISLVYALLLILFVRGLSGGLNLTEIKQTLNETFTGAGNNALASVGLFALLVASSGSSTVQAGASYQPLLFVIASLALIWALRQTTAVRKVRVRDAFYKGMYPLIPFLLVLFVIGLQLIPLLIGSWFYATVVSNAIAITTIEKALWLLLFLLLATLSLYMVCSSIFALYIVTLPDMTPMKALRSARQLVLFRRLKVLVKLLLLPILLLVIFAGLIIPLILFLTPVAEWAFFFLTVLALAFIHSYIYTLYRELLK